MAGSVPVTILALAEGVLKAMVVSKMKNIATAALHRRRPRRRWIVELWQRSAECIWGAGPRAGAQNTPPRIATPPPGAPLGRDPNRFEDSVFEALPRAQAFRGITPVHALVRRLGDNLIVTTTQAAYAPRQIVNAAGRHVTTYELIYADRATAYRQADVEVYDIQRRKLDKKDLPKWLKEEIAALVVVGTPEIDGIHLRLIKEGTLIFVLPPRSDLPLAATPPPTAPLTATPLTATPPPIVTAPRLPPAADPFIVEPQLPAGPPSPFAPPPTPQSAPNQPPPRSSQPREEQAKRELAMAEYYRRTGHHESAAFYCRIVTERFLDLPEGKRAKMLLQELASEKQAALPTGRVGEIIIVGKGVPERVILDHLPLYPGQVLTQKDLRTAQQRLDSLSDYPGFRFILQPIQSGRDSSYQDILIEVQTPQDRRIADDLVRLQGAWTVIAAGLDGRHAPELHGAELVFAGNMAITSMQGLAKSNRFSIDPSKSPKAITFTEAKQSFDADGQYEFRDDMLVLTIKGRTSDSARPSLEMKLALKRAYGVTPAPRPTDGMAPPKTGEPPAAKAPINLQMPQKGVTIAASAYRIEPNGQVLFTNCTLARRGPDGVLTVIRGDRVFLTLDAPLRSLADFANREIKAITYEQAEMK